MIIFMAFLFVQCACEAMTLAATRSLSLRTIWTNASRFCVWKFFSEYNVLGCVQSNLRILNDLIDNIRIWYVKLPIVIVFVAFNKHIYLNSNETFVLETVNV